MDRIDWDKLQQQIVDFVSTPSVELYIAAGTMGVLILFSVVGLINRKARKDRIKRFAPKLVIEGFQVSPLGRDAYLKIRNEGYPATLSLLEILGRKDLQVKNQLAGHKLERKAPYRILIESKDRKIESDFSLALTFMDQRGNVFRQEFDMASSSAQPPKLVRPA